MILMEEASRYSELVDRIMEIEKEAAKNDIDFIDTDPVLHESESSDAQKVKTYAELVTFIESVEGRMPVQRRTVDMKPQLQQVQPQVQEVPGSPQLIAAGITQTMHARGMGGREPPGAQQESAKRQKLDVANELSALADRLSTIKAPFSALSRKRINVKDLVLPSLSILDQVSELERIMEGLKENVFDSEHLDIVKQEVYGLEQVVAEGRAAVKKGKVQLTSLDQSMWTLRDQRLLDAMALIKEAKARPKEEEAQPTGAGAS